MKEERERERERERENVAGAELRRERIYYIPDATIFFSDIGGGSIAVAVAVVAVSSEKSGRSEFQG